MPTEQKYKDIYGSAYNTPEYAGMVEEGGTLPSDGAVTKELAVLVNQGKLKIHDVWARLTDDERDSFTGDMARIKEQQVANPSETNNLALKATALGLGGAAVAPMIGGMGLGSLIPQAARSVGGAIAGGEGIRYGGKALGLPPWLADGLADLFMVTGVKGGKGGAKATGEVTPKPPSSPPASATGTAWGPGKMPSGPAPKPPTASRGSGRDFSLSANEEASLKVLEDNQAARGIDPDAPTPGNGQFGKKVSTGMDMEPDFLHQDVVRYPRPKGILRSDESVQGLIKEIAPGVKVKGLKKYPRPSGTSEQARALRQRANIAEGTPSAKPKPVKAKAKGKTK